VFVQQSVLDDLGVRAAFQVDHHSDAVAVGLVAQVPDPFEFAVVDVLGDVLDETGLVLLVGEFGDDDPVAAVAALDVVLRPDSQSPTARLVGLLDWCLSDDLPAGREVRSLDVLGEIRDGTVGVLE
jgi:hypothetical protein